MRLFKGELKDDVTQISEKREFPTRTQLVAENGYRNGYVLESFYLMYFTFYDTDYCSLLIYG